MAFSIPQGISATTVPNIPAEWSASWFRNFITRYLEPADTRNAEPGIGIIIGTAANHPAQSKLTARAKISTGNVPLSSLNPIGPFTVVANDTGATAAPTAISEAQLTSMVQVFTASLNGAVPASGGGTNNFLRSDVTWATAVQSVALADASATPIYNISGSPVTGTGTLTETLKTQTANTVFAGPTTGAATQPTFRALVAADVPSSALPGGFTGFANPSGLIGMTAVNGVATTADRSDSTHAIDPAIVPTWTGNHTFTGTGLPGFTVSGVIIGQQSTNVPYVAYVNASAAADNRLWQQIVSGSTMLFRTVDDAFTVGKNYLRATRSGNTVTAVELGNATDNPTFTSLGTGATTLGGRLGINNNAPPAQVSGFGTPTGTGVIANFPGATATLAQATQAIAQLITDIKAFGLYAA